VRTLRQRRARHEQRVQPRAGQAPGLVGGGEQLAVEMHESGSAVGVVQRQLLEGGEGVGVEQCDEQGRPAVGQAQRAQQRDEADAGRRDDRAGIAREAREAARRDEAADGVVAGRRPVAQGQGRDLHAAVRGVGGGQHAALGIEQRGAAHEGQAGLGLAEQGLHHPGRCAVPGHVGEAGQRDQRRVQAAAGVVFEHACEQGLARRGLGRLFAVLAPKRVGGAGQQRRGEQRAGGGRDDARAPAGRVRHHGCRTMALRPWRLAASSSRPSRWMRCTKSSTAASQAASPGLTA
jgi:hypothetical protein